ncbi:MAG: type 1 periplasmic-binding domain-containing protein [Acidimicrobiales bacterium]
MQRGLIQRVGYGLAVALVLLTACSTTGKKGAAVATGSTRDTGGTGTSSPSGGSASATTIGPSNPSAKPGSGVGPSGGGAAPGGGPAPPGVPAATGPAATACFAGTTQGVTAKTITVGLDYSSDIGQANRATGGNSLQPGEPRSFGQAYLDYINHTGGLCGRTVVAAWSDNKVISGSSADSNDQASCTTYTQDNKVFAVMGNTSGIRPTLLDCLAKHGVLGLDNSALLNEDSQSASRYFDSLYEPYKMTLDRFFPIYVNALADHGYFDKGAKVGLIYSDIPAEQRAIDRTLIPALKAKGITLADQAKVTHTYDIDTLGSAETQTNSAVLRFQSENITHVLAPVDAFSFATFIMRAEQQGYRPRYGVSTSTGGPGGMGQNVQFTKAVMVAWAPAITFAEYMAGPAVKQCLAELAKEGHRAPADQLSAAQAFNYCDFFTFLRTVVSRAPQASLAAINTAATSVGTQYGTPTFDWTMSSGRHDGADMVRVATYSGGASGQWRYVP